MIIKGVVQVFISHHHSPAEDAFTARLVADLEDAGANVWVDSKGISSDDFVQQINEGLEGRHWLVLVMTPASVEAPWVQREVGVALSEVIAKRMRGVVPIVMEPTPVNKIPMLWRTLMRYDATTAYELARDNLFHAIGLSAPIDLHESPPDLPDVPARLTDLGFCSINLNGVPAIIPPLITIPEGRFLMGSDKTKDRHAWDDEQPQQFVHLPAFQIAKYPVTVAEYAFAVCSRAVREPPESGGVTWQKQQQHLDHPVVCVSWEDAMKYIAWLRTATGQQGWRLPTEPEWEKAARWDVNLSASRIYPWGDFFDQSRCNTRESGTGITMPVGSHPVSNVHQSGASAFGVEDMVGNIWEWTGSQFNPYDISDGRGDLNSTDDKVLRGGSRDDPAWRARAAYRRRLKPFMMGRCEGFRLAYELELGS